MDWAEFNPVVQHLANGGFAVLQINYRGSAGYGRSFREAGSASGGPASRTTSTPRWSTCSRPGVDAGRICIVGESYGGYSALMSVVRRPGRYRCAANWPASPTSR